MAKCKICGTAVKSGNVFHSDCWDRQARKVAEKFCEEYCRFRREYTDQYQLGELHCDQCPMIRLLNLGL